MGLTRLPRARRRARLCLEQLETRHLLSGFGPTSAEQLFLEDLNNARANPAAYGTSIGLDLSSVAPSQPLAFNGYLIAAARAHSQDMNNRGYFAHNTPEGLDPGNQMQQNGFDWLSWGQSTAGGQAFPDPASVNNWLGALQTAGRGAVANGFLYSGEYRSDMVSSDYQNLLHRSASAAEINGWVLSGMDFTTIRVGFEGSLEFYFDG